MAVNSQKRNLRQSQWTRENRDKMTFIFSKGMKDKIEQAVTLSNLSRSKWVELAINEKIARDAANAPELEDEAEDDAFCERLLLESMQVNDGETMSYDEVVAELGLAL